jgi:hypothetical protein
MFNSNSESWTQYRTVSVPACKGWLVNCPFLRSVAHKTLKHLSHSFKTPKKTKKSSNRPSPRHTHTHTLSLSLSLSLPSGISNGRRCGPTCWLCKVETKKGCRSPNSDSTFPNSFMCNALSKQEERSYNKMMMALPPSWQVQISVGRVYGWNHDTYRLILDLVSKINS